MGEKKEKPKYSQAGKGKGRKMTKTKKVQPKKMGRPLFPYSDALADDICAKIATSEYGLHRIVRENPHFPSVSVIYDWLIKNTYPYFTENYIRAKELQAEFMAENILIIADDGSKDLMTIGPPGREIEIENREVTNRSKLRVNTRMWLMSKILPKKYGNSANIDQDKPIEVAPLVIKHEPVNTDELRPAP